jgi:hypothetical protein
LELSVSVETMGYLVYVVTASAPAVARVQPAAHQKISYSKSETPLSETLLDKSLLIGEIQNACFILLRGIFDA